MASRIDVSIEHRGPEPEKPGTHPNTCPSCNSHYRDEELEQTLWVCPQCGHHFAVRARVRVRQLADSGTFVEQDANLRSADPLGFFDLRAYTERLAEAEVATRSRRSANASRGGGAARRHLPESVQPWPISFPSPAATSPARSRRAALAVA